jgi:hypothetical protein
VAKFVSFCCNEKKEKKKIKLNDHEFHEAKQQSSQLSGGSRRQCKKSFLSPKNPRIPRLDVPGDKAFCVSPQESEARRQICVDQRRF